MDSAVNIVEVSSYGKYRLNEQELQSIVSKAEECNDFAVISIIGAKTSGKTVLMDSLVKYLECKDKKNWPKDCSVPQNLGFNNEYYSESSIQMWSKPFILEANGHKTAVFLIDTSHVFQMIVFFLKFYQISRDLFGLLLTTSSTVICSDNDQSRNICEIIKFLPETYEFVGNGFQEMIYLIYNWNSKHEKYSLGLKGGQQYVQDQTQYTELNKYFKNIECCLLPPAGPALRKGLQFNDLRNEFLIQFSELIKNRLFNISEIQVKRHPVSQRALRPQELVILLRSYVNKLNGDSVSIDFGLSVETNDSNEESKIEEQNTGSVSIENILQTPPLSPSVKTMEKDLKEKVQKFSQITNEVKNTLEEVLIKTNKNLMNQKPCFGKRQSPDPFITSAYYPFGQTFASTQTDFITDKTRDDKNSSEESDKMDTNEYESTEPTPKPLIQNSTESTYASDVCPQTYSSDDNHLIGHQNKESENSVQTMNISQNDYSNKTINISTDESMDILIIEDNTDNGSAQQTTISVESKRKSTQEEGTPKKLKTDNEDFSNEILNYCEIKLNEYKIKIKRRLKENDVNLEKVSLLCKNKTTEFLISFDNTFKAKKYENIREEFRKEFYKMIDSFESQLVSEAQQLLTQINDKYDECLQQLLERYENRIKNELEKEYENDFKPILTQVWNKFKFQIISEYVISVEQMDKTNTFVTQNHLKILKTGLKLRENKYKNIVKVIGNYLKEWETVIKTNRYFDDKVLSGKHSVFKQNAIKSSDCHELYSFVMKIIDGFFIRIENQNTNIREKDIEVIEQNIKPLILRFLAQFSHKLKSGFYNGLEVKTMFEKLLNYTKESVEYIFDLKESQQILVFNLKQKLDSIIRKGFKKISSDYSQNTAEAKSRIESSQGASIEVYIDRMKRDLAQKTLKRKEFDAISSTNKDEALKVNEKRLESIKSYFNKDFFEFICKQNVDKIVGNIGKHEQIFFKKYTESGTTQTLPNTSIAIHFSRYNLFAAIYDTEFRPVLDKYNNICRPNCIAVSDETLFGSEAKDYIQSSGLNPFNDIKNLLFKKKSEIKVNSYPFQFSDNNNVLKVKIENKLRFDLSIEAMIALQVLDIKSDAEKQFGNIITRAVFTVPTHFSIKKRNAFKDVATIAGLESIHILSEITAAAIGYSNEVKPQTEIKVLFVAINDYECDAAVCRLKVNQIEYLSYFYENISSHEEKKGVFSSFMGLFSSEPSAPKEAEKIEKSLTVLLDKVFRYIKVNKNQIKDIVLIGGSRIVVELKKYISNYFKGQEVIDFTSGKPHNIVAEGSAIFCKSIDGSNSELSFDITEVAFHSLEYFIKEQRMTCGPKSLISSNTMLNNIKMTQSLEKLFSCDLPVNICIYQDKMLTAQFQINTLPSDFSPHSFKSYEIYFNFNNFGEISLSSHLIRNQLGSVALNVVPIRIGLSQNDLINDKEFIEKIDKHSKESRIESERKSMFDKSRKELSDRYLEIKKRVDNSPELGRLKKKKIDEELKRTEKLLSSTNSELKTITNQISFLKDLMNILILK